MEKSSTTEDGGWEGSYRNDFSKEIENLHRHRGDFIVPTLGPISALLFHPALLRGAQM